MKHFVFTRIVIIQRDGETDLVRMHTDMPSGITCGVVRSKLVMEFRTTEGYGPEYCKKHLGIEDFEIMKG